MSLVLLLALDFILAISIFGNYLRFRLPFLGFATLFLTMEVFRNTANVTIFFVDQRFVILLISGTFAVGRSIFMFGAASALVGKPQRPYAYAGLFGLFYALNLVIANTSWPPQVIWSLAIAPVVLAQAAGTFLLMRHRPSHSIGRVVLAGCYLLSTASLVLLGIFPPPTSEFDDVFYLADCLAVILAGVSFVVVALEQMHSRAEQMQLERNESDERYRDVFDSAFDAIISLSGDGRVQDLNPRAQSMFGWTAGEAAGKKFSEQFIDAADRKAVERAITEGSAPGEPGSFFPSVLGEHKDGHSFPVELIVRGGSPGNHSSAHLFARDLSAVHEAKEERDRFDAQLQHTQKLESLGVLAGGIAHDFNNFLGGILGFAGLAREALPPDSPAYDDIEEIETIAEQASDLTKQLLAYSGRAAFVQKPVQLSALVKEMERLIRSTTDRKAECVLELERTLPLIKGDSTQISQIVLNLVSNASDALDGNAGTIRIRTGVATVDDETLTKAIANHIAKPGPIVYLEVRDSGAGMDESTRRRMFDPFFTTKFSGRGLGMAAVIGIVRQHRGAIFVDSRVGRGTRIRTVFPVLVEVEPVAYLTPPEPDSAHDDSEWTGRGVALVVDDEPSIRTLARQVLEKRGFTVITAADGAEAIDAYKQHRDDLAVVLLDMTMPKVSGVEAFRAMRRIRDNVPILLSSGYNESLSLDGDFLKSANAFIQKPYRASALAECVREAIFSDVNTLKPTPSPE